MLRDKDRSFKEIIFALELLRSGKNTREASEQLNIPRSTLYRWEKQYAEVFNDILEMRNENERLRRMFTNASIMNDLLHETLKSLLNRR